jgi:hypothetical protein
MQVCSQPKAQPLAKGFRPVTILRQLSEGAYNKGRLDVRSTVVRSLFGKNGLMYTLLAFALGSEQIFEAHWNAPPTLMDTGFCIVF